MISQELSVECSWDRKGGLEVDDACNPKSTMMVLNQNRFSCVYKNIVKFAVVQPFLHN